MSLASPPWLGSDDCPWRAQPQPCQVPSAGCTRSPIQRRAAASEGAEPSRLQHRLKK